MILAHYEPDHLDDFSPASRPEVAWAVRLTEGNGEVHSVLDRGDVLAVCGVVVGKRGLGEGWMMITSEFVARPRTIAFIRSFLDVVVEAIERDSAEHDVRRLQVSLPRDGLAARRWARQLGFHEEGVMKAFGADGSDYVRIAMVNQNV